MYGSVGVFLPIWKKENGWQGFFVDKYAEKLQTFMVEKKINGELCWFDSSCHSVIDAATSANVDPLDIVKNICLMTLDDSLIVAIVKGQDRVSTKKVARALGLKDRPRVATPEEILNKTGYPCGGTPSFGYSAIFLVDERVLDRKIVYSGGGSTHALVKLNSTELLRVNNGRMGNIRK
jgi:Cys-tRNA(Pro)/Cys-tRNA(Cys) deacylase